MDVQMCFVNHIIPFWTKQFISLWRIRKNTFYWENNNTNIGSCRDSTKKSEHTIRG